MTSTSINQGLNEGSVPSSRVLRPPGGVSSNIFGTEPAVVASPARGRAPPSNNIFGAVDNAPASAPKHNRLASNVFGADQQATTPGRKGSKTYESNVFTGSAAEKEKSDEEKEEQEEEETQNNNDAKPAKAKGDSVYNPITFGLNPGQEESPPTRGGQGRAKGQYNGEACTFSINAQQRAHAPQAVHTSHRGYDGQKNSTVFSAQPLGGSPSRTKNADVSNPITGETRSFNIGEHHLAYEGAGSETTKIKPSTRVVQPPGGATSITF